MNVGSSIFALPVVEADEINKRIGGKKNFQGQYIVDCTTVDALPDIELGFGGEKFPLTGQS